MSKGSKRRPEDTKKVDSNWDKIFKKEPNISGLTDRFLEWSLKRKDNKLSGKVRKK